ncbi:protein ARMCX6-like [Suncus etruscus]|uniref:protein ARMCX6-like n=1 Tax=Suncus etruscus TaxID=109475 RepID=UPI002110103F|nr:protein ARMCX6-like [Suncus etruscus]
MGRAREVGWVAAGLMIGAGACYCVYKLTIGREDEEKLEEEEEEEWDDDQELDEEEPEIWFDLTSMARPWRDDGDWNEPGAPGSIEDRLSGGGKATRAHPVKQRPFPYEHKSTWSIQNFSHFTCALDLTKCRSIQEKMLFAQHTAARFSFNHNINTHLARLSMVENTIPTPNSALKKKALHVLRNLNVSSKNQSQIKLYLNEVCPKIVSHCCNLLLQQAGLNLLISMTVINNMLAKSFSDLKIPLITKQSGRAEIQALQPLMGLSPKPVVAGDFLGAQMLLSCK